MRTIKRKLTTKFMQNDRAASAIEFAIVAPIFILMMFGMCAYGIFFGTSNAVQQLAADAARSSIAGLDSDERLKLAKDFISRNLDSYMFLERENMKLSLGESKADTNQFSVSLSYDATHLPIWNLYIPLPLPSKTIIKTSTIRIGGI